MKKLIDFECANDLLDELILRMKNNLHLSDDDFPYSDDGEPTINNIMVEYLSWAVAVGNRVTNAPDLETFIADTRKALLGKDIDIDIETLRQWAYDMIDTCTKEIKIWSSVVNSYLQYQTINKTMIDKICQIIDCQ